MTGRPLEGGPQPTPPIDQVHPDLSGNGGPPPGAPIAELPRPADTPEEAATRVLLSTLAHQPEAVKRLRGHKRAVIDSLQSFAARIVAGKLFLLGDEELRGGPEVIAEKVAAQLAAEGRLRQVRTAGDVLAYLDREPLASVEAALQLLPGWQRIREKRATLAAVSGGAHDDSMVQERLEELRERAPGIELDPYAAPSVEPAAIAPFCAAGDYMNLLGPRSSGKTFATADAALAAIIPEREGRAVGGLFKVHTDRLPGPLVAIIDAEGDANRWASIFRALIESDPELDAQEASALVRERVRYFSAWSDFELRTEASWATNTEAAARYLVQLGVGLVIGDSQARIWAPPNVNDTGWTDQTLAIYRDVMKAAGVCTIMIAHPRRGGEGGVIGTSAQDNVADGLVQIAREETHIYFTHHKNRRATWIKPKSRVRVAIPLVGFGFRPEPGWEDAWPHERPLSLSGAFEVVWDDEARGRGDQAREWLLFWLEGQGEVQRQKILKAGQQNGHAQGTVREELQKAVNAGAVVKTTYGRYRLAENRGAK